MKESKRDRDRHLDAPSEANREKHINFPEVEQESAENIAINKNTSDRQKQWRQEIEEGEREMDRSNEQHDSSMPMDDMTRSAYHKDA